MFFTGVWPDYKSGLPQFSNVTLWLSPHETLIMANVCVFVSVCVTNVVIRQGDEVGQFYISTAWYGGEVIASWPSPPSPSQTLTLTYLVAMMVVQMVS